MKELFENIPEKNPKNIFNSVLIDTCFLVYVFEHNEKIDRLRGLCEKKYVGMTSFNIEEFLHIEHKIPESVRHNVRKFLHSNPNMFRLNIDVTPGNAEAERMFVRNVDEELLKHIQDPSDAVLIATAINIGADILTRDKHHLYTSHLENFLNRYDIKVLNKI